MSISITRVFLVRHGATVLSAEDRFAGATDVALSDLGREQARKLAVRLTSENVAAVYASPMSRTIETARIVAEPHNLEVQPRDGLREISHGRWEQLTRREVEERFPEEASAWEEDPFTFAPQGGESGLAVTARALPVLLELVRQNHGAAVLVVSHKATIRLLLSSLLGFDPRRYRDNLDLKPASLSIVDFKDAARSRLMLFNDTSHYANLPDEPQAQLSKTWNKNT
ncbi:MAG: histidine phosphatase family protein [Verrucomicrobiota bacterium]|nr:histidine phosphatase family protein [Verrucomicrobiota bacterium]MDQ6940623.1 histidine phosphatase family protein [Verrucomicrobiota bacterium]